MVNNFLYRPANDFFESLLAWLVRQELFTNQYLRRRFYWHLACITPEEIIQALCQAQDQDHVKRSDCLSRCLIVLAGKDEYIPVQRVRDYVMDKGLKSLFFPELGHGAVVSPWAANTQTQLQRELEQLATIPT